jgi:hypothetical protein
MIRLTRLTRDTWRIEAWPLVILLVLAVLTAILRERRLYLTTRQEIPKWLQPPWAGRPVLSTRCRGTTRC